MTTAKAADRSALPKGTATQRRPIYLEKVSTITSPFQELSYIHSRAVNPDLAI
jgi:hypothetical protein